MLQMRPRLAAGALRWALPGMAGLIGQYQSGAACVDCATSFNSIPAKFKIALKTVPERGFDAFTRPEVLTEWINRSGNRTEMRELSPCEGGTIRVDMIWDAG